MAADLLNLLASRRGHFRLESGHHGELWLELERLCLHPGLVRPFTTELARQLASHQVEAVCGPLNEGSFVALMVAEAMDVEFTYAERIPAPDRTGLFPVAYRVPAPLRPFLRGRRVAIVNDVINAGSAVRGTFADLQGLGAVPVALASLVVLGDSAARLADGWDLPLVTLSRQANPLWEPSACPLCAAGLPLQNPGGH